MSSVTVSILVDVVLWDGLAPGSPTLELDVVDVDTGVDDVDVNALTASRVVLVESEGSETESLAVRDTRETPWSKALSVHRMNNRVLLDISHLRHLPNALDDGVGETTRVALEVTVVHLTDANGSISEERVFFVGGLKEVEVVIHDGGVEVVLQHDDERVVENLLGMLSLEGMEGGERERRPLPWNIMRSR
jgi:hypothetical protein